MVRLFLPFYTARVTLSSWSDIVKFKPLEGFQKLQIQIGGGKSVLESPPPLGHSVVEYRELLERSDVDPRECTAQLEPPSWPWPLI
jgi:hypothetical protein